MGHRRPAKLLSGTPLLLAISLGTACALHSESEYVSTPPPAPRSELKHEAPGSGHAWVDGHWAWRGSEYVWTDGRWEKGPERHTRWVPGHWRETHRGWVWVEGHWR